MAGIGAKRALGKSGIEVAPIGLGCMSLSGTYGTSDDAGGIAVIQAALDRGVTMLDSSDMYGAGHNEELIRRDIDDFTGPNTWSSPARPASGASAWR